jgi:hypothetical protein
LTGGCEQDLVFQRPFVQFELLTALRAGKKVG